MKTKQASVLVIGGSRGLGRELGRVMAKHGSSVVLVAREATKLDETVAEIRSEGGVAYGVVADISDKNSIFRISGEAAALIGDVDVLIICSSTLGPLPLRMLLDTECEDLEHVLQVNLVGPFRLVKAVCGGMALRRHGVIILVSSDAAVEAYSGWGAYGISKAALDHFARILGKEMEGTGVRVLSVDPGEMDTQMHADAMPDSDRSTLAKPAEVARWISDIVERADGYSNGSRLIASSVEAL